MNVLEEFLNKKCNKKSLLLIDNLQNNKKTLNITHPHLLKEWDYEKNNELGIYPDKITAGSSKKVWWKHKPENHKLCFEQLAN